MRHNRNTTLTIGDVMFTAIALICLFLTGFLAGIIFAVALAVHLDPKYNAKTIKQAIRDDEPITPQPILTPIKQK